jgi:hypothetical protein
MGKLQYQVTSFSRFIRSSSSNPKETRAALRKYALTDGPVDYISPIYFFESVLWRQLMNELFENPFQPFGKISRMINETWCAIFGEGRRINNGSALPLTNAVF